MEDLAAASGRPFGGPTNLAAAATLLTFIGLYLADRVAVTRASGAHRPSSPPSDRGTLGWIVAWQLAGLVGALVAPRLLPTLDLPRWTWVSGFTLAWVGIALRVWSIRTLGPDFRRVVTVEADQRVVTTGPYRYVRHPSYTGILVAYAGLGLTQANLASVVAAIALPLVGYVRRIRVEEAALSEGLGERYRAYAAGRARLLPHVW